MKNTISIIPFFPIILSSLWKFDSRQKYDGEKIRHGKKNKQSNNFVLITLRMARRPNLFGEGSRACIIKYYIFDILTFFVVVAVVLCVCVLCMSAADRHY